MPLWLVLVLTVAGGSVGLWVSRGIDIQTRVLVGLPSGVIGGVLSIIHYVIPKARPFLIPYVLMPIILLGTLMTLGFLGQGAAILFMMANMTGIILVGGLLGAYSRRRDKKP